MKIENAKSYIDGGEVMVILLVMICNVNRKVSV